jgi:uncharacterized protein YgbK (DUF1537 family)
MTAAPEHLPEGLLLAFYGDDFTGSVSIMEVMTFAGLPSVLFLSPPTEVQLARFAGYRAIGVAGIARSQGRDWMQAELPSIFEALERLGAPVTHYKVCSTLDSSPQVGSIGCAIDIGIPIFSRRPGAARWQPLLVAAPEIRRLQAFGNLFAARGDAWYRLDRHPVMRRHPVTPMDEADVRLHLARQTSRPIGLVDFAHIKLGDGPAQFEAALAAGQSLIALDVVDDETLAWSGKLIWEGRGRGLFAVGSQGVEYALVAHWREAGLLPAPPPPADVSPLRQIVAASGSVSAVTADQIGWAAHHGFEVIRLDASRATDEPAWAREVARAVDRAKATLSAGNSPLLATARGPDDESIPALQAAVTAAGAAPAVVNERIGDGLGRAVARLLRETDVRRGLISGGDTSGHAVRALGIDALVALAPLGPGSALSRAFAADPRMDGIEIALKGGQMGSLDFFGMVRAGGALNLRETMN